MSRERLKAAIRAIRRFIASEGITIRRIERHRVEGLAKLTCTTTDGHAFAIGYCTEPGR